MDRSHVYGPGLHLLGPDYSFVTFPSTTQIIDLVDLTVWSRAGKESGNGGNSGNSTETPGNNSTETDAGTELKVDFEVQYALIQDRIPSLFNKVGLEHEPFVRNVIISAIKNNATRFGADEYLTRRSMIEHEFFKVAKAEALATADVDITNLRLHHVEFPPSVYSRKLDAAIQNQLNLIEEYKKTSSLVRGQTQVEVKSIENNAFKIRSQATAEAALLEKKASNDAVRIKATANREGLKEVSDRLGITIQKEILSLNYLISLENKKGDIKKYVNFGAVSNVVPI